MTREDVAGQTGINVATLYRLETARVRPQGRTLAALLDAYAVDDAKRDDLSALLKASAKRGWWHSFSDELPDHYTAYIEFESEAAEVLNYESLYIPGLLQTEDYAVAVIRAALPEAGNAAVEARVQARLQRQAVLTKNDPLKLWAIVDEAALRRLTGGPRLMGDQLNHLLAVAALPNVTLQVISFDAGAHPGMPGSFAVLQFHDTAADDVAYIEGLAGDLFLEEEVNVRRHTVVFEHLRAVALSPCASASLVAAIAEGSR